MLRNLLIAGALALALSVPAAAQECLYPFDETLATLQDNGMATVVVADEDLPAIVAKVEELTGVELDGVTRAFFVNTGVSVLIGLEVDGCLMPPIKLASLKSPPLSGRNKAGEVGA